MQSLSDEDEEVSDERSPTPQIRSFMVHDD